MNRVSVSVITLNRFHSQIWNKRMIKLKKIIFADDFSKN